MRVSIVVLNYNYARFVARAIESALAQDEPGVEVIVVDNGSTDESLEVIAAYEGRVRLVRQERNIGQGQGYNRGFESATGDWIIWLDADDLLDPDAVSTCLSMAGADVAKVQFPLRLIDAEGQPLVGEVPYLRHQGDVVPIIRRFGHYAGPPGSGNLYRRSAIAPYFPVEPADWPICTDTVPFVTAPFHGRVVDAGRALGSYRLHRKVSADVPGYRGNFSSSIANEVKLNYGSRDKTLALLRDRSGIEVPGPFLTLPPHVRNRIISWRFAPQTHPFAEDNAANLWRLMAQSVRACPGYNAVERLMMRAWAAGVLFMPRRVALSLMASGRTNLLWDSVMRWSRRIVT
jgi:glycosyltransferase involved in cell wall biosynthesis